MESAEVCRVVQVFYILTVFNFVSNEIQVHCAVRHTVFGESMKLRYVVPAVGLSRNELSLSSRSRRASSLLL